jgi:tetratricopeptide (TPR) repeat protein
VASETATQTSESGCSSQTEKTGTTAKTATLTHIKNGVGYYKNGNYGNALKSFNSVLKFQMIRRTEDDNPLLANTLADIGLIYLRQDRHENAVEVFENAVRMMRRSKIKHETNDDGENVQTDAPLAGVLNNLGTAKFIQGDHQASLECYWEAVKDAMTNDGGSNTKELANSLYNIGRISVLHKDYSMALDTLNKSLRLEKRLHGEKSIEIFDTLSLIGFSYYSTGKFDQAIFVFTDALAVATACLGSVNEKVAVSLINVGMVLEKEGDLDEALRCFSTAREVCKKAGLDEKNGTMHTATRSANDILRKSSVVPKPKSSPPKVGEMSVARDTTKPSLHQDTHNVSSGNPTTVAPPKKYNPPIRTATRSVKDIRRKFFSESSLPTVEENDVARDTAEPPVHKSTIIISSSNRTTVAPPKNYVPPMHTTTRSANDIRRKSSVVPKAKLSLPKVGENDVARDTAKIPIDQGRKTSSSSSPTPVVPLKNYDPRFEFSSKAKDDMDTYAAFKQRRKSERGATEYREDPFWEYDNVSIVEEDRDQ